MNPGRDARRGVLGAAMLLAAALDGGPAFALHSTPGVVEVGDLLDFTIPMGSDGANSVDLVNVRLAIVSAPPWLSPQPTSIVGPITLPPGEPMSFRQDFAVNGAFDAAKQSAELVLEVKTDTLNLNAGDVGSDKTHSSLPGRCLTSGLARRTAGGYASEERTKWQTGSPKERSASS